MKRIIFPLLVLASTQVFAEPSIGLILQDRTSSGINTRYTTRFYSDTQTYVNGGVIFTYPTDYWTYLKFLPTPTTPRITISVQLNAAASPTDTYSAVISANSPTSTTVLVYRISNGGGVTEASSDEISVVLLAIQDISPII
jgi:hypothetical protein